MSHRYVVALDQGTTSSRCMVFDHDARVVAVAQQEIERYFPQPGWVEQDPREIWSTQLAMLTSALAQSGAKADEIVALGITNQRETTIVWDRRTGEPVFNAIVWQCRRGAELIDSLVQQGQGPTIQAKTGLIPDAYFSASKIAWILDNVEGARTNAEAGHLLFGTVDTWLMYNLSGGVVHATDHTNASRTMLYNIHTLEWDAELLTLFNVPASMLPEVCPSIGDFGVLDNSIVGTGIPIKAVLGDQQAALFGQCCFERGDVKNTYGTGCFMLMNTGTEAVDSVHGLITTIGCTQRDDAGELKVEYALEGSVFNAGSALKWLRDGLHIVRDVAETEAIAHSITSSDGVYMVPAFNGLGAPYWNPGARGVISGITQSTTNAHIVRATLESTAYQTADVLDAFASDSGVAINTLRVDGGVAQNNFAMQFQSDILGVEVVRPDTVETTALGAAFAAGLAADFWPDRDSLRLLSGVDRAWTPCMPEQERADLLEGWHYAVERALLHSSV